MGMVYLSPGLYTTSKTIHILCFTCASLSTLQVTYRVVQVTDQPLEARDDGGGAVSVVSTAAFSGAPQAVAQVPKCPLFINCRKSTDNNEYF